MNKLILIIVLMICQSWSLVWAASYLLQLKNGNEIKTSHYWEEGDEIKFYAYGGVAGIQKGLVSKVTTSNVNDKEGTSNNKGLENNETSSVPSGRKSNESPQIQTGKNESQSGGNPVKGEAVDFDYYRARKAVLKEKLEQALQRNREAITRQDQEARESTRKEYLEFSKQIMDLGEELKKKNKDVLPDWWDE